MTEQEYAELIEPIRPPVAGEWFGLLRPSFAIRLAYLCVSIDNDRVMAGDLLPAETKSSRTASQPWRRETIPI